MLAEATAAIYGVDVDDARLVADVGPAAGRRTRSPRSWSSLATAGAGRARRRCCTRTAGSAVSAPRAPGRASRSGSSAGTRACDGGRTLVGGSGAVLHLRPRARQMLRGGTLVARDADSSTVAPAAARPRAGRPVVADAGPPTTDRSTDVTVVVPVRDRPRQLARLLVRAAGGAAGRWSSTTAPRDPARPAPSPRSSAPGWCGTRSAADRPPPATPAWPRSRTDARRLRGLRRACRCPAGSAGCAGTSTTPRSASSAPRARRRPAARRRVAVPLRGGPLVARPRPPARAGPAPGPGGLPARARRSCSPPAAAGCSTARRGSTPAMRGGRGRRPGLAAARRPGGGCATSRRPPYATTTGPRSVPGCAARRSTAPGPRCSRIGTAPTWRRWC